MIWMLEEDWGVTDRDWSDEEEQVQEPKSVVDRLIDWLGL